ncbi:MAG: DMT family transporter [Nitrososphaerota archaeon]|nr:DMT family transporter [Nitrososphaerota archaeon]
MAYIPIAAGLVAALCWGTSDYLSRSQSEKLGSYKTVVYSHVVTLVVPLALIPWIDPHLSLTPPALEVLAVAGGLNFIALLLLYRAFHRVVVSVVAPIAYTYPAVTVVLSVALLGTLVSPAKVVAITGIILGVILLSTRFSELKGQLGRRGKAALTAGVGSAVGCSTFFGMVYVGVGYAAPLVSLVIPALMLRGVGASAGFALAPVLGQDIKPSLADFSGTILVMGVLEAAGFLSFTYGIIAGTGSLPMVAALSGMGGAVAAGYGLVLLREHLELNQVAGVLLAIAGVFVLLYFGG